MTDMSLLLVTPIGRDSETIKNNQVIVTPDGVELMADLYIPAGKPPFPAIIEITPYSAQQQSKLGEIYATRGYLFVVVDARGRYRSAGEWKPMEYDQSDGHAVIEWVAKHELCNGHIGTRGHSYCAFNQLLAAIDAPSALKAMVVCVPPSDPFSNVPFHGGAYDINDFFWLLSMTGRVCEDGGGTEYFGVKRFGAEEFEENPYEQERLAENDQPTEDQLKKQQVLYDKFIHALTCRPFEDMDLRFGIRHDQFREWITHWQYDEYWQQRSVLERLSSTDVPTLHISGWWDDNGRGATAFWEPGTTTCKLRIVQSCQKKKQLK
ncbi:MAG: CocE/NonD family hydrolase [Gammaproteobacteria bacterium]